MESLARRGVRTTVAVAGLAALGVGLAAPAFASPTVPDVSGIGNGPAGPAAAASSEFTQASDAPAALPGLFDFRMPTAGRLPAATDAPPANASAPSDSAQSSESPESTEPAQSSDSSESTAPSTEATPPHSTAPTSPQQSLPVGVPQVQAGPVPNPASAMQTLDAANIF